MSREITVNPKVRDLPPQVVKGALYRAVNRVRVKSMLGNSTVLHVYEWLTGFVDTGRMDQNSHTCPAYKVDPNCKVCCFILDHFNTFRHIVCSEPLADLVTLMREIKLRADSAFYVEDKGEELIVAVTTMYLLEAAEGINKEVLKAELSEMEENGDFCLKGLNENVYFDEKFEASPLDRLLTTPKEEAINYRKAEWEGVTPVKHPKTSEIIEMDVDSLLDMYTHYKQLNSFYGDGSFNRQLGVIEAALKEHAKAREKSNG